MTTRPPARPTTRCLLGPALLAAVLAAGAARAETSPYYLGVAQSVAHDSNLYRLQDDQALPASVKSRSDTVYTTSLVAGVDQTWGRQRLSGDASLRSSRFSRNDQLNNSGYGINLGLDWATVERLSGSLNIDANRSLRKFDPTETGANFEKNIQTDRLVSGIVRVGVVTALSAEASLSHRSVDYSAPAYQSVQYRQNSGGLGLRYRPGGSLTLGAGARLTRTHYPALVDSTYDRHDVDALADWVPSSASSLSLRLSHSSTAYETRRDRDFSGLTGAVRGSWQATGKLQLRLNVYRDQGQDSSSQRFQDLVIASSDFSRIATTANLAADYALSGKLTLNAAFNRAHRALSNARFNVITGGTTISGSDDTTLWRLGGRWQPLRWLQLGCELNHEQRSASSNLSLPFTSNGLSCYGQAVLQ